MRLSDEVEVLQKLPSPARARVIRLAAGVSQERLAREIGVSRVTLTRWETGARRPRGAKRLAWAKVVESLRLAVMQ